jgi:uncharacterized repeat protein (TIGR03803 family)
MIALDSSGNLYGTTNMGGEFNNGVVFKVTPPGEETTLFVFNNSDGGYSEAGVTFDSAGNIYGTTYNGGTANNGVVYKLTPSGQETVLCNFTNGPGGGFPNAGIILDPSGNLYGTTDTGGEHGIGTIFKISF